MGDVRFMVSDVIVDQVLNIAQDFCITPVGCQCHVVENFTAMIVERRCRLRMENEGHGEKTLEPHKIGPLQLCLVIIDTLIHSIYALGQHSPLMEAKLYQVKVICFDLSVYPNTST